MNETIKTCISKWNCFSIMMFAFIFSLVLSMPVKVYAGGTISDLKATATTSSVTVSGTATDVKAAIVVQVMDGSDIVAMQSFSVNGTTFSVKLNSLSLTGGKTYTIRVADYDGGTFATAEATVPSSTGGGGGGVTPAPSDPETPQEPDAPAKEETTTETKTDEDGTVTETTTVKKPDGSESVTEKVTKPDGTVTESEKVTTADGATKETEKVSTKDGTVTETAKEVTASGTVTETEKVTKPTGVITETEKVTETNGTVTEKETVTSPSGAVKSEETITKADGSKEEIKTQVSADGKKETSTEVSYDATGKIVDAEVTVSQVTTSKSMSVSVSELRESVKSVGGDATVTITSKPASGAMRFEASVDSDALKKNTELKVYAVDKKGNIVILDPKKKNTAAVKNGKLTVNTSEKGELKLVTPAEAKKVEKKILASVKPEKKSQTVKKGKSIKFTFADGFSTKNIKKITYEASDSDIKVSKSGKITAKAKGTATVKVTVTLKNGKTKTIKMRIKIK